MGYLHALDATTGSTLWLYEADDESCSESTVGLACYQRFTAPVLVDGTLYVSLYVSLRYDGRAAGQVIALDASTGEQAWQYEASSGYIGEPVVSDGVLYVAGRFDGGRIHALSALSGELMWEYRPGSSGVYSIAVHEGLLLADAGSQVYALDVATGDFRWRAGGGPIFTGGPLLSRIVSDGITYVGYIAQTEDRFVRGVSALGAETGEVLWRYHTYVGLGGNLATVADGVLYVTPTESYYDQEHGYTGWYLYAVTSPTD